MQVAESNGTDKGGGDEQPPVQPARKALSKSKSNKSSKRKSVEVNPTGIEKGDRRPALNPSPTSTQDMHPYARGAVIEVWHIGKTAPSNDGSSHKGDDDWWSEPDSGDDDDGGGPQQQKQQNSVRLCDIIDRAQIPGSGGWRYYVHYRDFNRRMDEWVTVDRIVSPPSIGNAKARMLKKRQNAELQQREAQQLLWKQQQQEALLLQQQQYNRDNQPPTRMSRRRTTAEAAAAVAVDIQNADVAADDGGGGANSVVGDDGGGGGAAAGTKSGGRKRRQSRRKSAEIRDDATVAASNETRRDGPGAGGGAGGGIAGPDLAGGASSGPNKTKGKEILAMPTDAITTHTVGEHVLATVKAQELDEHEGLDEASLREHEEVTKVKNVNKLELGEYVMETWYFSPLPKEILKDGFLETLYVCEFTFNLFARKSELLRFQKRSLPVQRRHPPGNEIYRKGNLAMFEVDGLEEKIYCQNLCYIAKLFLDHKTLYFDVDPFLFYVLCEIDGRGFHPVGYYSKEKYSDVGYNLACILTFPAHQRKGYGRFLIAFSYELTKKEEKVGSPEKPMSDLGQKAYKPYWASTVIDFLLNQSQESSLSIMDISKKTSIMAEDIVFTLNQLGILKIINGVYFIAAERSLLQRLAQQYPVKEPRVDPSKLHWTPFLTDVKRDKFSIHSKKPSVEAEEVGRSNNGP